MENDLRRILRENSRALADELAAQLTSRSTSHYRETDPRVLSVRCRMLAEALIRSTHEGREHLGEFVAMIAGGRLAAGFKLEDLQAALRILEVRAWLIVVNGSTPASVRAKLTALNTTIGYARDELAPDSATANLAALNTAMGDARDELARVCQLHAFATAS